jgi:hypothetical protein
MLLRWSQHVPASDVQDPLGLGLRGSARLASSLLYCITSITPRARYFSFIPWSVFDYQQREKAQPYASGLHEAIVIREQALVAGCIAHHDGDPCSGGALVGSRDAAKWFDQAKKEANFKRLRRFSKNPALSAYYNSIVNLGLLETPEPLPDIDEESDITFDDLRLSDLGLELAKRYDFVVGKLAATKQLRSKDRTCSLVALAELGERGGLCGLADTSAPERELLRDIFFALPEMKGDSHPVRRQSLLLILELCHQFSRKGLLLDEPNFSDAVYYGAIVKDRKPLGVVVPTQLIDIMTRWRMFYFHYYMAVALEGLFAWLVSQLGDAGLAGETLDSLVDRLNESTVRRNLTGILELDLKDLFGNSTPAKLFAYKGVPEGMLDKRLSETLDKLICTFMPFAENSLEDKIRDNEHLYSATGLALPLILLTTTLARYTRWETTNYGYWLAKMVDDPFLDLVPPLLTTGLSRRLGDWWNCSWKEVATFVLSRYIIQQHQSMSYERTLTGNRCLLHVDGEKIFSTGEYTDIGIRNARLDSAIQILKDIGMLEDDKDDLTHLTNEGKRLLKQQLLREVENEIS